jgi:hypothetical protein
MNKTAGRDKRGLESRARGASWSHPASCLAHPSSFILHPLLAVVWQPIVSPLQIWAGAAVLGGLAIFAYVRTFRGRIVTTSWLLAMRLALIAAIGVLLMGPSSVPAEKEENIRPKLRILIDTSESMLTKDCGGLSRFQTVQEKILNENRLRSLSKEFQIEINGFDETVHPLSTAELYSDPNQVATGRATHLAECVTSFVSEIPAHEEGASLIVISDGRDTQSDPISVAAAAAKSRNVPVHTVALGGQTLRADLAVMAVPMQDYLLPDEPGAILVKVFQSGLDDAATTLTVTHGQERQKFPIAFNNRQVVEVQVPVQQKESGQYEYQVAIDPIRGEAETDNNRQTVFCDVQKKRIRLLLLEGQPFWDSKFLAQSLRKDEHIDVTQISQLSNDKRETIVTRTEDGSPQIPRTAEDWDRYDVVVLGQSIERVLPAETAALLDDFVSNHGGHVIFARGLAYDRGTAAGRAVAQQMSKLEPVVWGTGRMDQLQLALTPTGRGSQWFSIAKTGVDADLALASLPGFERAIVIQRAKPATIVLAVTGKASSLPGSIPPPAGLQTDSDKPAVKLPYAQPAIVRMTYGRGTVVGVLGDGLWRWSLLPPDKQTYVGFYDTFWSNLVRWLAMGGEFSPDQQVALHLSRTTLRLGDPLAVDVVYKHAPPAGAHPKLALTDPAHKSRGIEMEPIPSREPRFRAKLNPDRAGVYELTVETPGMQPARQTHRFNVYNTNVERLMTAADPMALRMLAEHSGGRFYEADRAADLVNQIRLFHQSQRVPPQLEYVWDNGAIMVLLLVWAGCEWLLRRTAGLL